MVVDRGVALADCFDLEAVNLEDDLRSGWGPDVQGGLEVITRLFWRTLLSFRARGKHVVDRRIERFQWVEESVVERRL